MNSRQNIVIELLAHQDLSRFQEFIKEHWKENHLFAKESSVFDWQHKGSNAYNCMAAKQGDDLVGVQGFIPQSHFDLQLPSNQIFLTLWQALDDRGIGIGLRLYKAILQECTPEFVGSIGLSRRTVAFHRWQGYEVGTMYHHVVLSPYIDKFKIADVPDNLIQTRPKKKAASITYNKIDESDLQQLNTEAMYSHQLPLKSDAYIINRYMRHPVYDYDVYAILRSNTLQALCVVRPVFHDHATVLRFVDFIGPEEAFILLRDLALNLIESFEAEYLDLYSYGIPSLVIEKAGFVNCEHINDLIIPSYFEPLVKDNVELTFAYKTSKTNVRVRLFKADGDQDRPNLI